MMMENDRHWKLFAPKFFCLMAFCGTYGEGELKGRIKTYLVYLPIATFVLFVTWKLFDHEVELVANETSLRWLAPVDHI